MAWQLRKVIENKKEEYIMQDKSKVIFNNEINMVMTAMPTIR